MSRQELEAFARTPTAWLKALTGAAFLTHLSRNIYGNEDVDFCREQAARFIGTVRRHRDRFGDGPAFLFRAPGRLNLFMEYLDICRGDHMSTTIDGDIPLMVSAAPGRVARLCNANPLFGERELVLDEEVKRFLGGSWEEEGKQGIPDTWETRTRLYPFRGRRAGDWSNYILAPFLRVAHEWPGVELKGCDMTFGPSTIPIRAGTSSSSAVTVLSMLALLHVSTPTLERPDIRTLCRLLGEAEWYVGTRGGANDQTTILRNRVRGILYNLHHLDLIDSRPLPWLKGLEVILCNSLWEADKALGARYAFNMRKGWTDMGRDLLGLWIREAVDHLKRGGSRSPGWLTGLLAKRYPDLSFDPAPELESRPMLFEGLSQRFVHLGSLDESLLEVEGGVIEELIGLLPSFISVEAAGRVLRKDLATLERDYTLPRQEEGGYRPRSAASFFYEENRIGRALEALLAGPRSNAPDEEEARCREVAVHVNRVQTALREKFQVSNHQLDLLLSIAGKGPGFRAGKLTGAGSGGCVCLFVDEGRSFEMLRWLDREYYGKEEHFSAYLKTLEDPSLPAEKAKEMKKNLEEALARPEAQRRRVFFSRGAGPVL